MGRAIKQASASNTLRAIAYNTDGSVKTDLAHNTTGISIILQRIGVADSSAFTLAAKSGTTWAAGAFLNLGGGDISVDVADAFFTSFLGECRIYGTFTGGIIVGEWYPVVLYDPQAVAVGAATNSQLTTLTTKIRKFFQISLRKDAAIATDNATELGEINADGGTGVGGYLNTTDAQEALRDRGDGGAWGGSSGATAVTLTLGATIPLSLGEVTGLTEPLVIGDDYTSEVGRRIPITLTDINGDAIAVTYGSHSLATDCSIQMLFQPASWTRNNRTTKTVFIGTCTFVAASGATPAYLWLTLPRAETAKAIPDDYNVQIEARWTDGFNVTLAYSGTATFTRDIQRLS
jgi:hypothetical protein